MTDEQRVRCMAVTAAASGVAQGLAEVLPTVTDIHAALKVALFLADKYLTDPNAKGLDYKDEVRDLVMKELGFVN
jgi:hypothetical protein